MHLKICDRIQALKKDPFIHTKNTISFHYKMSFNIYPCRQRNFTSITKNSLVNSENHGGIQNNCVESYEIPS